MTRLVTFEGVPGGDGSCFRWSDVLIEQRAHICRDTHGFDVEHGEPLDVIYPGDVLAAIGCEYGKRYRFTVTAEEIPNTIEG